MKIVLKSHSFLPGASGAMGEVIDAPADKAHKLIERGAAVEWQPPAPPAKSLEERIASLEKEVQTLREKDGKQK